MVKKAVRQVLVRLGDPLEIDPVTSAWRWTKGTGWLPAAKAKRRHLLDVLSERGHRTFIEAGTYRGKTVAFMRPHVDRIISVELDTALYEAAERRFAGDRHVSIVFGDATDVIPETIGGLSEPAMVWLDGHYSGEGTAHGNESEPVVSILRRIRELPKRPRGLTILIDDLRLFGESPTLDQLVAEARATFPDATIRAELDSIVVREPG